MREKRDKIYCLNEKKRRFTTRVKFFIFILSFSPALYRAHIHTRNSKNARRQTTAKEGQAHRRGGEKAQASEQGKRAYFFGGGGRLLLVSHVKLLFSFSSKRAAECVCVIKLISLADASSRARDASFFSRQNRQAKANPGKAEEKKAKNDAKRAGRKESGSQKVINR